MRCSTCKHRDKKVYEEPCRICEDYGCYEVRGVTGISSHICANCVSFIPAEGIYGKCPLLHGTTQDNCSKYSFCDLFKDRRI